MPKIKFLSREMAKKKKNASRAVAVPDPSSADRQGEREESEYDASETSGDETSGEEEEETSPAVAALRFENCRSFVLSPSVSLPVKCNANLCYRLGD